MALERWALGEKKPGVPADTWNAFVKHVEGHKTNQPQEAASTPYVPFRVKASIDMPRLAVVGLERPVPNPIGGAVTAFATVETTVTSGSITLIDVELVNNNLDPAPALPTSITHPGDGDEYTAGETVALSYDGSAWSLILSGQRGGHLKPPMMLGVPTQEKHAAAFAILQQPARAGTIVNAVASGVTWARITVTDESHTHAAPPANAVDEEEPVLTLQSGTSGAKVLWKEPGLGERFGLVLLGGSGGGSGGELPVFVYDDVKGATVSGSGVTLGAALRYLPAKVVDGLYVPDLDAEFGEARIWSRKSITLKDLLTSSCGCGGASAPTGIRITPGMGADGNDRVYDDDANGGQVGPVGDGLALDATVEITFVGSSATVGPITGTNNGDGTWSCPLTNISTCGRGFIAVQATDGATVDALVLAYAGDDSPTELAYFTGRPPRPDLTTASDTGSSPTDNITAEDSPVFDVAHGGVCPVDNGGPTPILFIDGENEDEGTTTSYDPVGPPPINVVELTVGSTLEARRHRAQTGLVWNDSTADFYGPPSLPLDFVVDPDSDDAEAPPPVLVCLGWINPVASLGETFATIDGCPWEVTDEDELAKLEA